MLGSALWVRIMPILVCLQKKLSGLSGRLKAQSLVTQGLPFRYTSYYYHHHHHHHRHLHRHRHRYRHCPRYYHYHYRSHKTKLPSGCGWFRSQ